MSGTANARGDVHAIPADWASRPLGDLATVGAGGTPSREVQAYWNGSIPWITTSQIDFNRIKAAEQFITEEGLRNSSAKLLPRGTLLLALYGQGKTRGKVGILDIEAATNQACASITPHASVSGEFLFHFLASRYESIRNASNSGGQENLSSGIVKGIGVCFPEIREQQAIADVLSDVDFLLARLSELVAKKRDLKQAAMQQLLGGRRRLSGAPGKWSTRSFDEVLSRVNAKPHQLQATAYLPTGDYPVVDQGQRLIAGFCDRDDLVLKCPPHGVIVFGDHTCIVKYVNFDFVVGADGTQVLFPKEGNSARFLAYYLQYHGLAQSGYNRHFKLLCQVSFHVPTQHEQNEIAGVLAAIDKELTFLDTRREKALALKQAMMQQLLTGRMRLI